jgi:RNA polymerase sigma-70 factor (ECF subfamily)
MREQPLDLILARPATRAAAHRAGTQQVATDATPARTGVDALARAAAAGDVSAVGQLYDELVGPVYSYIAMRVRRREDAEDLTQVVFERIVGGLPRYRQNGRPFTAWAFRIARNAVIDHVRRDRPTEPLGPDHDHADGLEVEAISLKVEQIHELRQAIEHLTPDQREALTLRFVAGLSAEEAAQVMGRRAGTIRGLTFRAIGALRRLMVEGDEAGIEADA